ncbi:hypothetical protein [Streptomyces sp. NBC_00209]|uniref:hypothetical protein n=1 Tax=Streptomyces sp. NBC_00209 TaxID=2975682 RepID=UPI0032483E49
MALERFRWTGGHADVWPIFRDPGALAAVVRGPAGPFRDGGVTAVRGVESRGFLLGAAVAVELGVGFVAVRKGEGIFPGDKVTRRSDPDYRGTRQELRLQRAAVGPGDRVLLGPFRIPHKHTIRWPVGGSRCDGNSLSLAQRPLNEFHKRGVSLPRTAVNRVT